MKMKVNNVFELFASRKPLVIDGALATLLEQRGCDLNDALWSAKVLIESPNLIKQVHADYFNAGAEIAITASYQATPMGLRARGYSADFACDLLKLSAKLALEARDEASELGLEKQRELLVAGSVGPYGAYLADGSEYTGRYTLSQQEFMAFHRDRMRELVEGGVDILVCETQPSFAEVQALLELLQREFPAVPAWFSFTLSDATHLSDGTPLNEVLQVVNGSEQVVAVGMNCVGRERVTAALKAMEQLTEKPLLAYPNSGERWDAVNNAWISSDPEAPDLSKLVKEWRQAGASLIGGCCRTTPADIHTVRRCFDELGY